MPHGPRSTHSLRPIILAAGLFVAALPAACTQAERSDHDRRSMSFSSGQYSQGYKNGMREAKQAWFDDHAGWMWLWMMDQEYRDGYERGWADGRRTLDLDEKQRDAQRNQQIDPLDEQSNSGKRGGDEDQRG